MSGKMSAKKVSEQLISFIFETSWEVNNRACLVMTMFWCKNKKSDKIKQKTSTEHKSNMTVKTYAKMRNKGYIWF